MAKDLIDDIRRPKRSLQDVLPASNRGEPVSPTPKTESNARPFRVILPVQTVKRSRRRWPMVLLILLVIMIPVTYLVSVMFGRATVIVTPRRLPISISEIYRALHLPADTISTTTLGFQTMTIQGSDSAMVPAGQMAKVSERSSGTIVISNRYSQKPQRLLANTRFEAPDSKIYRIQEAVLVPGYTLNAGTLIPGEFIVTVKADQPGADYNNSVATKEIFTIPGFKSDARFNTITARGKTPLAGGFIGERKSVNPVDQLAVETELVRRLKDRLLAEAASQTPDQYVWYPSTVFWRLGVASTTEAKGTGNEIKITRRVELVVPIFSREELSQSIARRLIPDYDGALVLIKKIERLDLRPIGVLSDPVNLTDFTFTLEGQGVLVWQFSSSSLARDLAGRNSNDYQAVFVKYPSITNSQATFSPPWLIRFPTDSKQVTILTESEPSARMSTTTNQRDITNGN